MLFCLQAEEDFFSTVVYTELAPLETAMIVSQVWKHNRPIWEKFNHLGSHGIVAQQSYLRKVKVSLFTWNRCSTTWRQRVWVSGPPLGWPRSRNATPRNEQVLWMINCFYFFADTLRNHQAKIFPLFWFQVYRDRRAAAGAVVDDHSSTSQKSWTYSHAGS